MRPKKRQSNHRLTPQLVEVEAENEAVLAATKEVGDPYSLLFLPKFDAES
jgi:hypothetical protein